MSTFPKIPFFKGDTDEDSIHLNSKVGPAKPLPKINLTKTDKKILQELHKDNGQDTNEYNRIFGLYKNGRFSNLIEEEFEEVNNSSKPEDHQLQEPVQLVKEPIKEVAKEQEEVHEQEEPEIVDEDETVDENEGEEIEEDEEEEDDDDYIYELSDENDFDDFDDDTQIGSDDDEHIKLYRQTHSKTARLRTIDGLIIIVLIFLILTSAMRYYSNPKQVTDLNGVNNKFNEVDYELSRLEKLNQENKKEQTKFQESLNEFNNNINSKFEIISGKFNSIAQDNLKTSKEFQKLTENFEALNQDFSSLKVITDHSDYENRLTNLNEKLNDLAKLSDSIESFKQELLDSLFEALPQHLPIYIKQGKVHYIPEFNKFLYNFIDSYYKESNNLDWTQFLTENKQFLTSYIEKIIASNGGSETLSKDKLEQVINEKLITNNDLIYDRINQLIDSSMTNSTTGLKLNSNKILLDNLMEIFSKGSINTNYADYNLKARILGFLTSSPGKTEKSLNRKLFLGWYDYLINSTPSADNLKFNANNILIDGGDVWQCKSDICSVGIRLSNSVILTDLVIKNANYENLPTSVSIYIKPKTKVHYNELIQYLLDFKIKFNSVSNNKYLTKFIKIRDVQLDNKLLNHIKLPISLVNLRIPTKDIYLEFKNSNGDLIDIFNVKAYGISEYKSYKYNEEFNLLIDNLKVDEDIKGTYKVNDEYVEVLE